MRPHPTHLTQHHRLSTLAALLTIALTLAACDPEPHEDPPCDPAPGRICTLAGTRVSGLSPDGLPPRQTELYLPIDLTISPDGLPYLMDWNNHRIRVIRDGAVHTVVGTGYLGDAPNGHGPAVSLNHPTNVAFAPDGAMIIAAWHNSKVLRYDPQTEMVSGLCGTGARSYNGDGLPPLETFLDLPSAIAFAPNGDLYIADQANQRIRRLQPDGTIDTIAGTGAQGYSGDGGLAIEADLHLPTSQSAPPAGRIITDKQGVIYLTDTSNHVIRRIGTDGIITTIAGTGQPGLGGDGPSLSSALNTPSDVAIDADGNLYVADTMNHCVRKVSPDGQTSTAAGTCGKRGFTGDGGPATAALLDRPYGVDVGPEGNLYIADTHNHVFRVVYR